MFKFIGVVAVVVGIAGAALYFTGNMSGSASIDITDKGKKNFNQGLTAMQEGVNGGLDSLKVSEGTKKE
jgi:hypothetical protein